MRSPFRVFATLLAAVGLLVASSAGLSAAAQPAPSVNPQAVIVNVLIGNLHSGKCLEIAYSSTANFAPAGQYTCHGGPNQKWSHSTTTGLIQNQHSGKCLEVAYSSTADGAAVGQYDCHGGRNQQWYMNPRNGLIGNLHSGKCLEIAWASTADFARTVQWPCHGMPHQVWRW